MKANKKIELYIGQAEPFAQPILWHLLKLIHASNKEVDEVLKWGMPHFLYKGKILCAMAAFKKHMAFIFWLESKMKDPNKILRRGDSKKSMGHLGKITSLKDLPSDKILKSYIKQAMELIDEGVTVKKQPSEAEKKKLIIPIFLAKALKENKEAKATFDQFNYSNKKEYVEWLTSAKTEATQLKRLKLTIQWLSIGKIRNWKYVK